MTLSVSCTHTTFLAVFLDKLETIRINGDDRSRSENHQTDSNDTSSGPKWKTDDSAVQSAFLCYGGFF